VIIFSFEVIFSFFLKSQSTTHISIFQFLYRVANCNPLGNLLIIQNENKPASIPNDSAGGGCLVFNFTYPVSLLDMGLLDIDERKSPAIYVEKSDFSMTSFNGPSNIGDNGFWAANKTLSLAAFDDVKVMKICFPGSGAVAFLHYEGCPN
jgi:hypothetical protein